MNKISWLVGGIAIVALALSLFSFGGNSGGGFGASDTTLSKVLSFGTIKVGYVVGPPIISKDPKTGELSGIFYDITNALAKQLELKVEWVEEGGYGTVPESLKAGRYDVFSGMWANTARSKAITFTSPLYYDVVYAYARTADRRFDNNYDAINAPSVRISTIDGELGDSIAKESFPNAQRISLPQTAPFAQIPLQVIESKADIMFLPPTAADLFLQENPGTFYRISNTPIRVFGNVMGVKLGETAFQESLDAAIQEILNTGEVDRILEKHDPSALRLAPPYAR